jgi:hypothetical protein
VTRLSISFIIFWAAVGITAVAALWVVWQSERRERLDRDRWLAERRRWSQMAHPSQSAPDSVPVEWL